MDRCGAVPYVVRRAHIVCTCFYVSLDQTAYELNGGQYSVYGIQYQPGFDSAVSLGQAEYSSILIYTALSVYNLDCRRPNCLDTRRVRNVG